MPDGLSILVSSHRGLVVCWDGACDRSLLDSQDFVAVAPWCCTDMHCTVDEAAGMHWVVYVHLHMLVRTRHRKACSAVDGGHDSGCTAASADSISADIEMLILRWICLEHEDLQSRYS